MFIFKIKIKARLSMAEKLAALRKQTQERGISAYIIRNKTGTK